MDCVADRHAARFLNFATVLYEAQCVVNMKVLPVSGRSETAK
jgi:hypothetical protein